MAKYSSSDDMAMIWGSLGDSGRVRSVRGRKHDANVEKTSKRNLKAKAKHARPAPKGKKGK
jgi:hypothetical protein